MLKLFILGGRIFERKNPYALEELRSKRGDGHFYSRWAYFRKGVRYIHSGIYTAYYIQELQSEKSA